MINRLQLGNLSGLLGWTKGNGLCATTVLSTTLTCTMTGTSMIQSTNVHSLTLCVPVSVAHRQYPPLCRRTVKRHHPQIGKDCWNLSRMFTETATSKGDRKHASSYTVHTLPAPGYRSDRARQRRQNLASLDMHERGHHETSPGQCQAACSILPSAAVGARSRQVIVGHGLHPEVITRHGTIVM